MKENHLPYEESNFVDSTKSVWNYSLFNKQDLLDFKSGIHAKLYNLFGSHNLTVLKKQGFYFSVWAPNATYISVVGDFNDWDTNAHPLFVRLDKSGIWEGFIPGIKELENYKYYIVGYKGLKLFKGDPFAKFWELRPKTSSKTKTLQYEWNDKNWMKNRKKNNSLDAPWSVYEVHLGSWTRPDPKTKIEFNTYREISDKLVPYVKDMEFTHVELMPVMEFPYDGSWGYQGTGYFAPTSRFGSPEDLMAMINSFHNEGIGVILDWVPSHYPSDAHGLYMFDGTYTYEYADPMKGFHPDWNSYIFNYERGEVRSFLLSNAYYWFEKYHIDGLRVDAVSSLVQLDYSRGEGEWKPNIYGGNGNLEAISLLKLLNEKIYHDFPDVQMIAEESANYPHVTGRTVDGGLGFGMKWMMGWMHDTLEYYGTDPYYRNGQQDKFTFSMVYYYNENYMLPLSHDEVVHGKSPMLYKMPGSQSEKFANLRVLYTYMFTHPGAKLLFMGNEFGQTSEWNFEKELDWKLLQFEPHLGIQNCVKQLNKLYRTLPALFQNQFDRKGFEWVDLQHRDECIIVYKRKGKLRKNDLIIILNNTPVTRTDWKIDVKGKDSWKIIFSSDDVEYFGSGKHTGQEVKMELKNEKKMLYQVMLTLPGLSGLILQ